MLYNAKGMQCNSIHVLSCREALLQHDAYTVPAAYAELGLLYIATGDLVKAQRRLEAARCMRKIIHPLHAIDTPHINTTLHI